MTSKRSYHILFLLAVFAVTVTTNSCSTKKNSFTRRVYHNLTGHYNMFWNGRESYRDGVKQLEKTAKDNYTEILRFYNFGTEAEAQALNPYMDKAIEKAALNIQNHSMFFNRKEYVRWIDDSYFLIGLGYFYKQDYNKSKRTFEFITNEYKKNAIRYDALLWMGNSYLQQKKYKRAETVLDNLKNEINKNPDVSESVKKSLPLVRADLYIVQKKYGAAKEQLLEALFLNQKKKSEARVKFILGQIYQSEGELYKASEYYKQVVKMNPPYEMAFNAAINLAQSYDTRYGMDSKSIIRNLEKMLKEDKNKDYRDQIYFALADIATKDGQDTLAIHYLKLSVATSKINNYQKAASSLKLGDLYFIVPNYKLSQAYYDTAMQVLPKDYPNYDKIKDKTTYLTELVTNLIVVETEDSLQRLVAMNEEDRNSVIDKIIEDLIAKEEQEKELEELQLALGLVSQEGSNQIGGPSNGGWYFYNPTAITFGAAEFKKKWGNRKYEENWRLSNKQAIYEPTEIELTEESDTLGKDSTIVVSNDPHKRDYYLQNLPFTPEKLAISDSLIENALYNLGFIYKDKLEDDPKSIESFDTLLQRFPGFSNRLEVYYQLNRLFTKAENPEMAEYYKNLIVENFPESDYAKLLLDPNYFKELEAQKNLAYNLYGETYDHYQSGRYFTVYSNSNRALKEFAGPPDILAKFEYLRALSLGKIEVVDSLKLALENLVAKYPDSEVIPLAQNILNYLKDPGDTTSTKKEPEEVIDVSIYEFNPNSKQIFALVIDDENININALKVRISDFNQKFYSLENLSITNILLNSSTHFVMVGNFASIKDAMNYYNAIMANDYVFANLNKESFSSFSIAQENYPVFYKDKDVKKYLAFFKKNYFKNQ